MTRPNSSVTQVSAPALGVPSPAGARPTIKTRGLSGIYSAPPLHWVGDGFRVAGYLSQIPDAVRQLSPFLLLDYHPPYEYPPTRRARGVGVHPHRGFETVTLAWQGSVAHHDSAGGGGVIGPGDAQWMTAASGVLHKEYHEQNFAERGGVFHMAQLWVNLPRAHRMAPPRYQGILASDMGRVDLPHAAGSVRILAGEYGNARGPAKTFTPISIFDLTLTARGSADFTIPSKHNLAALIMQGNVRLNDAPAREMDFAVFANDGDRLHIEADSDAQVLLLGGEPIDEPVVQYGPFVMNTEPEILEAFRDFSSGRFGHLAD
ncbi:MAG TPA: pirin family protein [Polyangiaceae bacterium]|nr:pirin family protein [Polyangiaceae bacterium]